TRSGGRYCCSSRSVASKLPISAPDADMRETNSSSMFSTVSASTVPSVDIASDSSRTSSSSSSDHTLPPYCSPSASISMAARRGPVTFSLGLPAWRAARPWITLVMSLALVFTCGTAMSGRLGGFTQPLTDNGDGFIGIAFGQFAHAMHRLGVNLALDLGDIDQMRGRVAGKQGLSGRRGDGVGLGRRRGDGVGERRHLLGRQHLLDQRAHHHE